MIDPDNLSKAERKRLCAVANHIRTEQCQTWGRFLKMIYPSLAKSDADNFRKGDLSKSKCGAVYRYIAEHHAETGKALDKGLFAPEEKAVTWETLIAPHALYGKVHVRRLGGLCLIARTKPDPVDPTPVPLNTPFCFAFDDLPAGALLAMQREEGSWYPLPLGQDEHELISSVSGGKQSLPFHSETQTPIPLYESGKEDTRSYVFIIGEWDVVREISHGFLPNTPILPKTLDGMAQAIQAAEEHITLYRLNVRFIAQG